MKETVTKVIDTLTQEDFHEAFQKLFERSNKCIAAGGDYFEGDKSFMRVLSRKVPIRKKSGSLFNDPRIIYRPAQILISGTIPGESIPPIAFPIYHFANHAINRFVFIST